MSEVKRKCKYKNQLTGWECPYEALEDSKEGFCIFHDRRKDKDIKKFNEGIKQILEDKDSDAYYFEGFYFPDSVSFSGVEFNKDTYFNEAGFTGPNTDFVGAKFFGKNTAFLFAQFIGKNTDFSSCEFTGEDTCFGVAKFAAKKTSFRFARFSAKNTLFSWARLLGESVDFNEAEFSGENTYFVKTEFSGRNIFFAVKFAGGNTIFEGVEFSGEHTHFNGLRFTGKEVDFSYCKFPEKIVFDETIFKAKTKFISADLRKFDFRDVDLKNVDFSLLEWDWKYKLGNEIDVEKESKHEFYFKTSEVYRQLKVQFHNKRDFAKAGMFHFREQECKREACKLPKDFFKWIFLRFLKWSCGYGEKLWKVLLSSVELILTFAVIYMWWFGLYTNDKSPNLVFKYKLSFADAAPLWTIIKDYLTSVSFSLKGFFPLWRFQQYKLVGDFANLVTGIEFLLGAFFVGLFIYVFRRRMEK